MIKDKKGKNLEDALFEAGIDSTQVMRKKTKVSNKQETVYHYMIWSRQRDTAFLGTDVRLPLGKTEIETLTIIARNRGFLVFLDKEFKNVRTNYCVTSERKEMGVIFFPAAIVGRMKRFIRKTNDAIIVLAPYLKGETSYLAGVMYMKEAQNNLLAATKYAQFDREGEMATNSFSEFEKAIRLIRNNITLFRQKVGITWDDRVILTNSQEEVDQATYETFNLADDFYHLLY